MDDSRFDVLAKTLAVATNRRVLAGLVAGALAAVGLTQPAYVSASKSGLCKKDCGACGRCQKGKCERNKKGKRRCKNGKCVTRAIGASCVDNNVTGTCQSDKRCCRVAGTFCTDACPGTGTIACSSCCSGSCNTTTTFCI